MSDNTLGEYIRKKRKEKGYTLKQLGEKIDFSDGYISMVETGIKKNPSALFSIKAAKALDIHPSELMFMAGHYDELKESLREEGFEVTRENIQEDWHKKANEKFESALPKIQKMQELLKKQGDLKLMLEEHPQLKWNDRTITHKEREKIYNFIAYFIMEEGD